MAALLSHLTTATQTDLNTTAITNPPLLLGIPRRKPQYRRNAARCPCRRNESEIREPILLLAARPDGKFAALGENRPDWSVDLIAP